MDSTHDELERSSGAIRRVAGTNRAARRTEFRQTKNTGDSIRSAGAQNPRARQPGRFDHARARGQIWRGIVASDGARSVALRLRPVRTRARVQRIINLDRNSAALAAIEPGGWRRSPDAPRANGEFLFAR